MARVSTSPPPRSFPQMTRHKKQEQKAREQLFDVEEDEEEDDEEEAKGPSKRKVKRRRGGADSDSDDEDKDAGIWADNEAEAMLGPGDEAKVKYVGFHLNPCRSLKTYRIGTHTHYRCTNWRSRCLTAALIVAPSI